VVRFLLRLVEKPTNCRGRHNFRFPSNSCWNGRAFLDFHILLDTKNGWKVPQPLKNNQKFYL